MTQLHCLNICYNYHSDQRPDQKKKKTKSPCSTLVHKDCNRDYHYCRCHLCKIGCFIFVGKIIAKIRKAKVVGKRKKPLYYRLIFLRKILFCKSVSPKIQNLQLSKSFRIKPPKFLKKRSR